MAHLNGAVWCTSDGAPTIRRIATTSFAMFVKIPLELGAAEATSNC